MNILVHSIIVPDSNIAALVKIAKETLDYSARTDITSPARFLTLLSKIVNDIDNDIQAQRNLGRLTDHLMYSFIVVAMKSTIYDLITETNLICTKIPTSNDEYFLCIVSASLSIWKQTLIDFLRPNMSSGLRQVLTQCLRFFDSQGYNQLFSGYRRREQSDHTLLLEIK